MGTGPISSGSSALPWSGILAVALMLIYPVVGSVVAFAFVDFPYEWGLSWGDPGDWLALIPLWVLYGLVWLVQFPFAFPFSLGLVEFRLGFYLAALMADGALVGALLGHFIDERRAASRHRAGEAP